MCTGVSVSIVIDLHSVQHTSEIAMYAAHFPVELETPTKLSVQITNNFKVGAI